MLQLSIQDYEGKTTVIPLTDGELTIGREEGTSICLTERNVSRQHAKVVTQQGRVWLENLAATYGTRLNNTLLRQRTELSTGDVIRIGDYEMNILGAGEVKRDTALVDEEAAAPAAAPPENATAIVNLADLQAALATPTGNATNVPAAEQPRLLVESDNLRGWEGRVSQSPTVIGRTSETADLVIDHRSISKEHARLTRKNDGVWEVLDLGSANGIQVNGEPYSKSVIKSGDKLTLGHVTLRFLAAGESAPARSSSSGGGKGLLIAVAAVIGLGVIAGAGYLVLAPKDSATSAKSSSDSATATSASKSSKELVPAAKVAPSKAPSDQDDKGGQEVATLLIKTRALEMKGQQDEALKIAKAALETKPGDPELLFEVKRLQRGKSNLIRLVKQEANLAKNPKQTLDAVEDLLEDLKSHPALLERAEALKVKATRKYVDRLVADAERSLARKRYEAARDKADMCLMMAADNEACQAVLAKAKEALADRADSRKASKELRARRRQERAPRDRAKKAVRAASKAAPAKRPAKQASPSAGSMSAKELYLAARKAALGDKSKAVSLFEQAAKKGYRRAHGKLARLFYQLGKLKKCAYHGKKYLNYYPGAGDAPQIEGLVEKCE